MLFRIHPITFRLYNKWETTRFPLQSYSLFCVTCKKKRKMLVCIVPLLTIMIIFAKNFVTNIFDYE